MKVALHGHMGRDEALADNLVRFGHELYVAGGWENPGLVDKAEASGGRFHVVRSLTDVEGVADFIESVQPDMALTNFDDSLAAGFRDVLQRRIEEGRLPDLLIPTPDRESAKVEWDKFFLRDLIDEIDPSYNPDVNFKVTTPEEAIAAIDYFVREGKELVIKPRNPTGGKGVKVMGKHFHTYAEAQAYALSVLNDPKQSGIEVQERLDEDGHEFTLQLFTDGTTVIRPPATYDYPYREDGDTGPGTGGMGTFSSQDGLLPFLTREDYDEMVGFSERLLARMKEKGLDYKGVFYITAFKLRSGQKKVVEVNARGGDPELINVIDSLEDDVDMGEVLRLIALGELQPDSVRFKELASAMLYLVSPGYGYPQGQEKVPDYEFDIDPDAIAANDVKLRFAAAERVRGKRNRYRTTATSRIVGLSALGATPWAARAKILAAIDQGFAKPLPLTHRLDIADEAYIRAMAN